MNRTGHRIFTTRPQQQNRQHSNQQEPHKLDPKASLVEPQTQEETQATREDLAKANSQRGATLNNTKIALLTRRRAERGKNEKRRTAQQDGLPQHTQQRETPPHIQNQTQRDQPRNSNGINRVQRMQSKNAKASQKPASATLIRQPYLHDTHANPTTSHHDNPLDPRKPSAAPAQHKKAGRVTLNNVNANNANRTTIEAVKTTGQASNNTKNTAHNNQPRNVTNSEMPHPSKMAKQKPQLSHPMRTALLPAARNAFIQ
ncbi:FUSC family membrane protein [Klebsiella michiganensis]|uniref:FUSC family membrane protein n=1 Tax=Klebsiella michiganensis TaxID=1134687 RepID=UPI001D17A2C5|nr:FUSC family membrane protein [Klebsiella michiganensis]